MKALLEKLLPLDRLVGLAMKFGLLKAPLEAAAKAWVKAQGARTQIAIALCVAVSLAAFFGVITWEQAEPILNVLAGIAGAAFADKLNRALPAAKKASRAVSEEGKKRKG